MELFHLLSGISMAWAASVLSFDQLQLDAFFILRHLVSQLHGDLRHQESTSSVHFFFLPSFFFFCF